MNIKVYQIPSEYKATWWWNALYDNPTEVAEWIPANNYCELHEGEITARCNNGGCDE